MKTSDQTKDKSQPWMMAVGGIVLLVVLVTVGMSLKGGEQASSEKKAADMGDRGKALPTAASIKVPEGVESFENEGQNHVADGTKVPYKTNPPTSGPHYNRWMPPSVYAIGEAAPELLVHNLEHGNVVIYFNQAALGKNEVDELTELSKKYIGQWDGVLLVAREDKEYPLILTAWRNVLRLKKYDQQKVLAFLDAFRGRGPENPVR
jgi:hypothetical protein